MYFKNQKQKQNQKIQKLTQTFGSIFVYNNKRKEEKNIVPNSTKSEIKKIIDKS